MTNKKHSDLMTWTAVVGFVLAFLTIFSAWCHDARAGVELKRSWGPSRADAGSRVVAAVPAAGGVIYRASERGKITRIAGGKRRTIADADAWASDLALGNDGSLYLLASSEVIHYSARGNPIGAFGGSDGPKKARIEAGSAIVVSPDGTVLVADAEGGCVVRYRRGGTYLGRWCGEGRKGIGYPTDLAVQADGSLLVVDGNSNVIHRLSPDGKPAGRFGTRGWRRDRIFVPDQVAVDQEGRVFVADWDLNRIQAFTAEGDLIEQWGRTGYGGKKFEWIVGLEVGETGRLLVADVWGIREFELDASPAASYAGIGAGTLDWNVAVGPGKVAKIPVEVFNFGDARAVGVTFCYRARYMDPVLRTAGPRCRKIGELEPSSSRRFEVKIRTPKRRDPRFDPMGYDFDVAVKSRNAGSVIAPSNVWVKRGRSK